MGQPEPPTAELPGDELVAAGVSDLAAGRYTVAALLIAEGTPRLREAGVDVPEHTFSDPPREMYELLEASDPAGAYTTYNALRRRLVSFCEAAEHHARFRDAYPGSP